MRKAISPPSPFWSRLVEAFQEQGLRTSQRAVARMLDMSQGSVNRWYHGESLPELYTCRRLAIKGKVTVDWLITARKPKYPISADPVLSRIMEICIELDGPGRDQMLKLARREKAQKAAG